MRHRIVLFSVVGLVVVVGVALLVSQQREDEVKSNAGLDTTSNANLTAAVALTNQPEANGNVSTETNLNTTPVQVSAPAVYTEYSAAALEQAHAQGKVVLFFHAQWCPFCKEADADIQAKLSSLPAWVTVLKTDYDTETALKKRYGVTYQHTFVYIDREGNELKQWSGGGAAEIVTNIQ